MRHISVLAAKRRRQGNRRGHQAGVLAGEEGAQEIAVALGGEGHPVAARKAERQQTMGQGPRLRRQVHIGQNLGQLAA